MDSLLFNRELGCFTETHKRNRQQIAFHESLLRRLKNHCSLQNKAYGSSLAWDPTGRLLAVAGEDCTIRLWNADGCGEPGTLQSFDPGHTDQITCTEFLPGTGGNILITAGPAKDIRLIDLEREAVRSYSSHECSISSILPLSTSVFASGGLDGTIRCYDSRARDNATDRGHQQSRQSLLVDQRTESAGRVGMRVGVQSMSQDPVNQQYIATGGGDALVRVYDLRMMRPPDSSAAFRGFSSLSPPPWCYCLAPTHLRNSSSPSARLRGPPTITSISYDRTGLQLLACYAGDAIYSFDPCTHGISYGQLVTAQTQPQQQQQQRQQQGPGYGMGGSNFFEGLFRHLRPPSVDGRRQQGVRGRSRATLGGAVAGRGGRSSRGAAAASAGRRPAAAPNSRQQQQQPPQGAAGSRGAGHADSSSGPGRRRVAARRSGQSQARAGQQQQQQQAQGGGVQRGDAPGAPVAAAGMGLDDGETELIISAEVHLLGPDGNVLHTTRLPLHRTVAPAGSILGNLTAAAHRTLGMPGNMAAQQQLPQAAAAGQMQQHGAVSPEQQRRQLLLSALQHSQQQARAALEQRQLQLQTSQAVAAAGGAGQQLVPPGIPGLPAAGSTAGLQAAAAGSMQNLEQAGAATGAFTFMGSHAGAAAAAGGPDANAANTSTRRRSQRRRGGGRGGGTDPAARGPSRPRLMANLMPERMLERAEETGRAYAAAAAAASAAGVPPPQPLAFLRARSAARAAAAAAAAGNHPAAAAAGQPARAAGSMACSLREALQRALTRMPQPLAAASAGPAANTSAGIASEAGAAGPAPLSESPFIGASAAPQQAPQVPAAGASGAAAGGIFAFDPLEQVLGTGFPPYLGMVEAQAASGAQQHDQQQQQQQLQLPHLGFGPMVMPGLLGLPPQVPAAAGTDNNMQEEEATQQPAQAVPQSDSEDEPVLKRRRRGRSASQHALAPDSDDEGGRASRGRLHSSRAASSNQPQTQTPAELAAALAAAMQAGPNASASGGLGAAGAAGASSASAAAVAGATDGRDHGHVARTRRQQAARSRPYPPPHAMSLRRGHAASRQQQLPQQAQQTQQTLPAPMEPAPAAVVPAAAAAGPSSAAAAAGPQGLMHGVPMLGLPAVGDPAAAQAAAALHEQQQQLLLQQQGLLGPLQLPPVPPLQVLPGPLPGLLQPPAAPLMPAGAASLLAPGSRHAEYLRELLRARFGHRPAGGPPPVAPAAAGAGNGYAAAHAAGPTAEAVSAMQHTALQQPVQLQQQQLGHPAVHQQQPDAIEQLRRDLLMARMNLRQAGGELPHQQHQTAQMLLQQQQQLQSQLQQAPERQQQFGQGVLQLAQGGHGSGDEDDGEDGSSSEELVVVLPRSQMSSQFRPTGPDDDAVSPHPQLPSATEEGREAGGPHGVPGATEGTFADLVDPVVGAAEAVATAAAAAALAPGVGPGAVFGSNTAAAGVPGLIQPMVPGSASQVPPPGQAADAAADTNSGVMHSHTLASAQPAETMPVGAGLDAGAPAGSMTGSSQVPVAQVLGSSGTLAAAAQLHNPAAAAAAAHGIDNQAWLAARALAANTAAGMFGGSNLDGRPPSAAREGTPAAAAARLATGPGSVHGLVPPPGAIHGLPPGSSIFPLFLQGMPMWQSQQEEEQSAADMVRAELQLPQLERAQAEQQLQRRCEQEQQRQEQRRQQQQQEQQQQRQRQRHQEHKQQQQQHELGDQLQLLQQEADRGPDVAAAAPNAEMQDQQEAVVDEETAVQHREQQQLQQGNSTRQPAEGSEQEQSRGRKRKRQERGSDPGIGLADSDAAYIAGMAGVQQLISPTASSSGAAAAAAAGDNSMRPTLRSHANRSSDPSASAVVPAKKTAGTTRGTAKQRQVHKHEQPAAARVRKSSRIAAQQGKAAEQPEGGSKRKRQQKPDRVSHAAAASKADPKTRPARLRGAWRVRDALPPCDHHDDSGSSSSSDDGNDGQAGGYHSDSLEELHVSSAGRRSRSRRVSESGNRAPAAAAAASAVAKPQGTGSRATRDKRRGRGRATSSRRRRSDSPADELYGDAFLSPRSAAGSPDRCSGQRHQRRSPPASSSPPPLVTDSEDEGWLTDEGRWVGGVHDSSDEEGLQDQLRGGSVGASEVDPQEASHARGYCQTFSGHRNTSASKNAVWMGDRSQYVVSGSDDGSLFVWDASSGSVRMVVPGGSRAIRRVQVNPNQMLLASCAAEPIVRLWSPEAEEAASAESVAAMVSASRAIAETEGGAGRRMGLPGLLGMLSQLSERLMGGLLESPGSGEDDDLGFMGMPFGMPFNPVMMGGGGRRVTPTAAAGRPGRAGAAVAATAGDAAGPPGVSTRRRTWASSQAGDLSAAAAAGAGLAGGRGQRSRARRSDTGAGGEAAAAEPAAARRSGRTATAAAGSRSRSTSRNTGTQDLEQPAAGVRTRSRAAAAATAAAEPASAASGVRRTRPSLDAGPVAAVPSGAVRLPGPGAAAAAAGHDNGAVAGTAAAAGARAGGDANGAAAARDGGGLGGLFGGRLMPPLPFMGMGMFPMLARQPVVGPAAMGGPGPAGPFMVNPGGMMAGGPGGIMGMLLPLPGGLLMPGGMPGANRMMGGGLAGDGGGQQQQQQPGTDAEEESDEDDF